MYIECRVRTETYVFISTPREPFKAAAVYSDVKTKPPSPDGAPLSRMPQSYTPHAQRQVQDSILSLVFPCRHLMGFSNMAHILLRIPPSEPSTLESSWFK